MDAISSGLTWREVQAKFDDSKEFSLVLNYVNRRANKHKRRNGEGEDRKLWRLFLQRNNGCAITTVFRKNIRIDDAGLLDQAADDGIVGQINRALALA